MRNILKARYKTIPPTDEILLNAVKTPLDQSGVFVLSKTSLNNLLKMTILFFFTLITYYVIINIIKLFEVKK